jgi:hypothetical protein
MNTFTVKLNVNGRNVKFEGDNTLVIDIPMAERNRAIDDAWQHVFVVLKEQGVSDDMTRDYETALEKVDAKHALLSILK